MKRTFLFIVLLSFSLSASAQMRFITTNGEDIKLRHVRNSVERKVKVYLSEEEIPANAERIGILLSSYKKREKAFLTAKNFAARAGGQAILFVDGKDMTTGDKVANAFLGGFKGSYYFWVYRLKES